MKHENTTQLGNKQDRLVRRIGIGGAIAGFLIAIGNFITSILTLDQSIFQTFTDSRVWVFLLFSFLGVVSFVYRLRFFRIVIVTVLFLGAAFTAYFSRIGNLTGLLFLLAAYMVSYHFDFLKHLLYQKIVLGVLLYIILTLTSAFLRGDFVFPFGIPTLVLSAFFVYIFWICFREEIEIYLNRQRALAQNIQEISTENRIILNEFFEKDRLIMIIFDPDSNTIKFANKTARIFLGIHSPDRPTQKIIVRKGTSVFDLVGAAKSALTKSKDTFTFQYSFNGNSRFFEVSVNKLTLRGNEQIVLVMDDHTDRIASVAKLERTLNDRETLLREVHHRVKNNMQLILSIMRLQEGSSQYPNIEEAYAALEERILVMSLLHENLYHSADLSSVDIAHYLQDICDMVCRSYGFPIQNINIIVTGHTETVDIVHAHPLGLIVCELVTNSIQHAFSDPKEGRIQIHLDFAESSTTFDYSDNGKGLPEDFNLDASRDSLGMTIITSLVSQLDGSCELMYGKDDGMKFSIKCSFQAVASK